MWSLILFLFVIGLCFGSFLNVVVLRTVKKKSFVNGRSMCPKCKHQLSWYDNIPVISYFLLGRKCRYCKSGISVVYPIVEILTGIFFVWWFLIGFGFFRLVGSPWSIIQPVFWLGVGLLFIVIFVTDLLYMLIPFGLNLALFFWVMTYKLLLVASSNMRMTDFVVSILVGLGLAGFFVLVNRIVNHLKKQDGFGWGDVYLAPALGLLMGWPRFLVGVFLAFMIGAIVGVLLIALGKKKKTDYLPFAPFLLAGTTLGLIYGSLIWEIYLRMLV